ISQDAPEFTRRALALSPRNLIPQRGKPGHQNLRGRLKVIGVQFARRGDRNVLGQLILKRGKGVQLCTDSGGVLRRQVLVDAIGDSLETPGRSLKGRNAVIRTLARAALDTSVAAELLSFLDGKETVNLPITPGNRLLKGTLKILKPGRTSSRVVFDIGKHFSRRRHIQLLFV